MIWEPPEVPWPEGLDDEKGGDGTHTVAKPPKPKDTKTAPPREKKKVDDTRTVPTFTYPTPPAGAPKWWSGRLVGGGLLAAPSPRLSACVSTAFPCPPPEHTELSREENADDARWWYASPSAEEVRDANEHVLAFQRQVDECAERLRARIDERSELSLSDQELEQAIVHLRTEILRLKSEALDWGRAALRTLETGVVARLVTTPVVLRIVVPAYWIRRPGLGPFKTLDDEHIRDELLSRKDSADPVTDEEEGWFWEQAEEFAREQRKFDAALEELEQKQRALENVRDCAALFLRDERKLVAAAIPNVIDALLDERYIRVEQTLRAPESRYDLSTAYCELLFRLCRAMEQCRRLGGVIDTIEAMERMRLHGSSLYRTVAAMATVGFSEIAELLGLRVIDCGERVPTWWAENRAESLIALGLSPLACHFFGRLRSLDWNTVVAYWDDYRQENAQFLAYVKAFVDEVDGRVNVSKIAVVIAGLAEVFLLARSIVKGIAKGWRALTRHRPPTSPFRGGRPRLRSEEPPSRSRPPGDDAQGFPAKPPPDVPPGKRSAPSAAGKPTRWPDGIPPEEGARLTESVRSELGVKWPKRNVAVSEGVVDGQPVSMSAVSGEASPGRTVSAPTARRFTTKDSGAISRANDTEVKILESLAERLNPNSTGVVNIFTERAPCASCLDVINQFRRAFPGVRLNVTHGN